MSEARSIGDVEPSGGPPTAASGSLMAGYWSFGQFWGVWVIVVFEFQRYHGISDAQIGIGYTFWPPWRSG